METRVPFRHLGRRFVGLSLILILLLASGYWAFHRVGRWLVRQDNLQHADAVIILSGIVPYRAMEAAEIYRQGFAPQVWLLRDEEDDSDTQFAKLGIVHPNEQYYDELVLERMGVPKQAIQIIDPPTTNTVSEIHRIAEELRKRNGDRIIIVTSPLHTRRSGLIWRLVVGDHPQAIIRIASKEPADPDHWWHNTKDIHDVEHELLGLINARLGFIAGPR